MSSISSSGEYEKPTNAETLVTSFVEISQVITAENKPAKLIDPMSQYVTFEEVKVIKDAEGLTLPNEENNFTMTWDLAQAEPIKSETVNGVTTDTYSMTYRIKVNRNGDFYNAILNSRTEADKVGFVPTNGRTSIEYSYNGTSKTLELPVPTVTSTLPVLNYSISYFKEIKGKEEDYDKVEEFKGKAEFGTVIDAPDGYENKYSSDNYVLGGKGTSAINITKITVGLGKNEIMLYYDPIPATVTVNHYLVTKTASDSRIEIVGSGDKPTDAKTYSLYMGDTFTNTYFLQDLTPVKSVVGQDGNEYTSDNYKDIKLSKSPTTINLYYYKEVEARTPVGYKVNYHYRTNEYKLVEKPDGTKRLELVDGEYSLNAAETITGSGYLNTKYTAPDKSGEYELDYILYNGTDNNDSYTVTLGTNNEKNDEITAENAILTVEHKYFDKTINGLVPAKDAYGIAYDYSVGPDDVYVGEVYTIAPDTKGEFTRTTPDTDLRKEITAGDNVVTVNYERDVRVPVDVVVNHNYTAYKEVVDDKTGVISELEDTEAIKPMDFHVNISGKYAGEKFTPEQIPMGFEVVEGSDISEATLVAGTNTFNIYYKKVAKVNGVADITVNHIYRTYRSYVNDAGVVVENELSATENEAEETHYGQIGESFTAEKRDRSGFTFNEETSGKLELTLETEGGQVYLYYDEYVNELGEKVSVTVLPVFKTISEYVDDDGSIKKTTTYENGTEVKLGDFYKKQTAIANPDDYATEEGFSYDATDEENTFVVISGTNINGLVVGGNNGNVIKVVYKKFIPLKRVPVQVRNFYTYIEKDETGKVTQNEFKTLKVYNAAMVLGQSIDTNGLGTAKFQNFEYDFVKGPKETVVLSEDMIENGVINLDFYWKKSVDKTAASVQVTHLYKTIDLNPTAKDKVVISKITEDELTGFVSGATYKAIINTNKGTFAEENVVSTDPIDAITSGIVLHAGKNTITINYEKTIDTRIGATVTVKHNYYAKNNALYGDKTDAEYIAMEGIKPEYRVEVVRPARNDKGELITYAGMSYTANEEFTYISGDIERIARRVNATPENLTITVDADSSKNVIEINYIRDFTPGVASVTVSHRYYTVNTRTGARTPDTTLDKTITETSATNKNIWVGNRYEAELKLENGYSFASTNESRIIEALGPNGNSINLEYARYYTPEVPPVDPTPDNPTPDDPTPVEYTPVVYVTEEIADEETPLADAPVEVQIVDEETPLVAAPVEPIEIIEEEVPLAAAPKTGDVLFGYVALAVVSGLGLLAIAMAGKKKEEN